MAQHYTPRAVSKTVDDDVLAVMSVDQALTRFEIHERVGRGRYPLRVVTSALDRLRRAGLASVKRPEGWRRT